MRNFILILIIVCILSACRNHSQASSSINHLTTPNDFYIDSIRAKDERLQITFDIEMPIFKADSICTLIIQKEIQIHKQNFIDRVKELISKDSNMLNSVGSFFSANPVLIYQDTSFTSTCFVISTYFAGNAHPLTIFKSFNFDRKLNRLVDFKDYFNVSTQVDSLIMKELINKAINRQNIGVNNIYKMDFCLIKDSISFNFSDYEIASYGDGFIQAHVSRQSLNNLIKKIYR